MSTSVPTLQLSVLFWLPSTLPSKRSCPFVHGFSQFLPLSSDWLVSFPASAQLIPNVMDLSGNYRLGGLVWFVGCCNRFCGSVENSWSIAVSRYTNAVFQAEILLDPNLQGATIPSGNIPSISTNINTTPGNTVEAPPHQGSPNPDLDSTMPPSEQQIPSLPAGDHTHTPHLNPITTTHSTVVGESSATNVVESSQSLQGILMPSSRLKFL